MEFAPNFLLQILEEWKLSFKDVIFAKFKQFSLTGSALDPKIAVIVVLVCNADYSCYDSLKLNYHSSFLFLLSKVS